MDERERLQRTKHADLRAESRRRALRGELQRAGMTPTDAARAAGMVRANSLFNFLGGRSRTLSADAYERLSKVIPGTTLARLQGLDTGPEEPSGAGIGLVELRAAACAGLMRSSFDLPASEKQYVAVPINEITQASGAFALRVEEPGAERLFAANSLLVCVPATSFERDVQDGQKLILQRIRDGRVEVTVRELALEANEAWLWLRSTHPDHQAPLRMPYRPSEPFRPWRAGEDRYAIGAVVVLSCVPHAGDPYQLHLGPKQKTP